MNSFVVCVEAVLPIFVLMAAGYLCQRLGVIKREAVPAMNRVAFTVFLSTMVFNSIYTSDIAASVDPFLLAYTAVAAVVVFAAASAVVKVRSSRTWSNPRGSAELNARFWRRS